MPPALVAELAEAAEALEAPDRLHSAKSHDSSRLLLRYVNHIATELLTRPTEVPSVFCLLSSAFLIPHSSFSSLTMLQPIFR